MIIHQTNSASNILIGGNGAVIVKSTDLAATTGKFYAIKAVTACQITTMTFEKGITGSLDGVTISAGDTLYLYRFTSVQLTSGTAIVYKS